MSTRSISQAPISPGLVLGLLGACAVIFFVLLPSKRTLLQREVKDGDAQRALATLRSLPPSERAKDPAYFSLLELQLERQQIDRKQIDLLRRHAAAAWRVCEQFHFNDEFFQEALESLAMLPNAAEADAVSQPYSARMPSAAQRKLADQLVAAALARNQTAEAARIYSRYFTAALPSETNTTEMVRLWRFSQRPDLALKAIENFYPSSRQLAERSPALARLRIGLLRETGQPSRAFDALRDLAAAEPSHSAEFFDSLLGTARESSRLSELLTEIRQRAAAAPLDPKSWRLLDEAGSATGNLNAVIEAQLHLAAVDPAPGAHFLRLAQCYEWTARPELAFDYYLRALKARQFAAVERLFALNRGLNRDAELAQALEPWEELLKNNTNRLELARLQAATGDFQSAAATYEKVLAREPSNARVLEEDGRLMLDLMRYDEALKLFQRLSALRPQDPVALNGVAEAQFRTGRYQDAFHTYQMIVERAPDENSLDDYVTLAESMARPADAAIGLKKRMDLTQQARALDFQRLAYYYKLAAQPKEETAALVEGTLRFPTYSMLRELAAYALADSGRSIESLQLLADRPEPKSKPELRGFYLTLLVQHERWQDAEKFISGLDPKPAAEPSVVEARARIYQGQHRFNEAAAILAALCQEHPNEPRYFESYADILRSQGRLRELLPLAERYLAHDPAPPVLAVAAEAYIAAGRLPEAEACQRRYLRSAPRNPARAWGFMGEILRMRGEKAQARHAFQRGMDALLQTDHAVPKTNEAVTKKPVVSTPASHRAGSAPEGQLRSTAGGLVQSTPGSPG